jgi:chorismate mutase
MGKLGDASVLLPVAGTIGAGSAQAQAARPASHPARQQRPLCHLVEVIDQRLELADAVAAAKWSTHGAIDDPAREQVVLDAAAAGAVRRGLDPAAVRVVFRDQIEASKAVQYGLFSHWSSVPTDAPTQTPDLAAIRPVLDRITGELLDGLAATRQLRSPNACELCAVRRGVEQEHHLDALHRQALGRALRSVCE